jgi:membrane protein DedA with SNARE-associated domain
MHWIAHIVRAALIHYGYLALAAGLIAEDAGLPLPGETVLMFSSFLAHKGDRLSLPWIILVGTAAAVIGDNLGFLAGRWFGPRFLRWLKRKFHMEDDIAVATDQIRRHGGATVFWARFIFGLRTVTGPVAGALDMPWREFLLFNALGAASWVSMIALVGYAFGAAFNTLLGYFEKGSWAISGGLLLIGYLVWRRRKREYHERQAAGA